MSNKCFIPDKELYCTDCLNKINRVKNKIDKLLIKSQTRNFEINNLLDNYITNCSAVKITYNPKINKIAKYYVLSCL